MEGLRERRLAVHEDYFYARMAAGMDREVIPGIRLYLANHPFRERAWSSLILAQYRSGDVPAALASYTQALATLRDNLGVDPGPELLELHRAVLARDPRLSPRPQVRISP
jgi:DNA-binding SARP family transcriptional activator